MKSHKDLDVWKSSVSFVEDIYRLTSLFPKEEVYGLTSQLRRAAVSIPSNIAEGAARQSDKEFIQFLYISLGSVSEIDTQIEISQRLVFIDKTDEINQKLTDIKKMILGLIKYLKGK
ncbi:MAG: four helix bundle protein [Arcobacteraceae bacterium]|nr:four helix bundle protein [Arcobacteraceae bacterium]